MKSLFDIAGIIRIARQIADQYDAGNDSNAAFCRYIRNEMENAKWTYNTFVDKTLLNPSIYYAIRGGKLSNPEKDTVVAICIGLAMKWFKAEKMLNLCGYTLRNTKADNAYRHIFDYSDQGIDFCNEILRILDIPLLGSQSR